MTQSLGSQGKTFVFCSKFHGKPSVCFKQKDDMVSIFERHHIEAGHWGAGGTKGDLTLIVQRNFFSWTSNLPSSSPGLLLRLKSTQHAHHLIRKLFPHVKGASPARGGAFG